MNFTATSGERKGSLKSQTSDLIQAYLFVLNPGHQNPPSPPPIVGESTSLRTSTPLSTGLKGGAFYFIILKIIFNYKP
jgi:hypothetical protein